MNTFFHIGQNLALSKKEIKSIFPKVKLTQVSQDLIAIDSELTKKEIEAAQKRMGGVIKISDLIGTAGLKNVDGAVLEILTEARKNKEGKLRIGVNLLTKKIRLGGIFKKVKKELKSIRFLNNNFKNLDPVVTKKQILNKGGTELNVIEFDGEFFITETISAQDIESYKLRDYDKPARSAKVGMLPPKLAQILINFAGTGVESIWDPFCGTGTVLMEGMNNGVKNIYGSDLSEEMIESCKTNTKWFSEEILCPCHPELVEGSKIKIFNHDASEEKKIKVDCVVSEGYLGIPLLKYGRKDFAEKNDKVLAKIWQGALANFAKNGIKKLVFCLPCYPQVNGKKIFCEKTLEIVKKSQYTPLAENLIYGRKGQFVHRQIQILSLN